jgi:hypothetical protein
VRFAKAALREHGKNKEDMKGRAASLALSVLLVLLPSVSRAQDFSADVAYTAPKSQGASSRPQPTSEGSRLFVSKDKMRLDTPGVSPTALLVDFGNQTTTVLFPAHKAYQELASGPAQYFRVTDPDNACPDWRKAVGKEIACEKEGNDLVDGRKTVRYLNKSASRGSGVFVWIDPSLKFVIKWEDADGGAELHNIKEGPQRAELFTVPPGYDVLKPQKKGHWKTQRK